MTLHYTKEQVAVLSVAQNHRTIVRRLALDCFHLHAEVEAKDRRITRIEAVRDALRERQRVYQAREDAHREAGELGQAQRLGGLRRACQEIAAVLDSALAPEAPTTPDGKAPK